jgi:uncharacterized protein
MPTNKESMYAALKSVSAYRALLKEDAGQRLTALFAALEQGAGEQAMDEYTALFQAIVSAGCAGLGEWFLEHLHYDSTPFAEAAARGIENAPLTAAAEHDISVFTAVCSLPCKQIKADIAALLPESWRSAAESLPEWENTVPFTFADLRSFYRVNGAGMFARYRAFTWSRNRLLPVEQPDFVPEEELWGYRLQRDKVVANTRGLIEGRSVNNVLLFGDPGTGKSATVKALLGMQGFESLRLIEIRKTDLGDLGELIRMLGHRPQKFILFIDDLAFDKEDMTYSVMKSALEGGLEPRPKNVAVYATSNRRNLVRQNFSDRNGDEIDANETIQEKTSLAERFGLRIPYTQLNRNQFLTMVEELAQLKGIHRDSDWLRAEAVKWEMRHSSRTPRTALQFLASLPAE